MRWHARHSYLTYAYFRLAGGQTALAAISARFPSAGGRSPGHDSAGKKDCEKSRKNPFRTGNKGMA